MLHIYLKHHGFVTLFCMVCISKTNKVFSPRQRCLLRRCNFSIMSYCLHYRARSELCPYKKSYTDTVLAPPSMRGKSLLFLFKMMKERGSQVAQQKTVCSTMAQQSIAESQGSKIGCALWVGGMDGILYFLCLSNETRQL